MFGKQEIARAVQVRELLEEQGYPSTAECGLLLNLEGIPGCGDMPEDVRTREITGSEVMPDDVAKQDAVKQ